MCILAKLNEMKFVIFHSPFKHETNKNLHTVYARTHIYQDIYTSRQMCAFNCYLYKSRFHVPVGSTISKRNMVCSCNNTTPSIPESQVQPSTLQSSTLF